jgi:iron complex outermembrane recepter protein
MPTPGRGPRLNRSFDWPPSTACRRAALLALVPLAAPGQPLTEAAGPASSEVVIVTARKVEEDVFAVPMSVQVLPRNHFETTDPTDLYELQFDVPGLVVANTGMNGAGISLRGVTADAGQGLAIAPHFDGVYQGRSMVALSRLFDIERVEVLKGPQGTLYGRNATGGSINVISRAPENAFGADVETALGSFDTLRVEGHVNFAPREGIAFRLAGVGSEGDGFIRNSVDERRFAEQDYHAMRASLRVQPTDELTIDATAEHMNDDGGSGELWLPNRGFLPDPDDIHLTTVTLPNPYLHIEHDIVSIDVARDFDSGTLTSVTGYVRNVTRDIDDCSSLPSQGCIRSYQPQAYEQRSQEIRFASPPGERRAWLLGFYFLDTAELANFMLAPVGMVPLNDYSAHQTERAAALFGQASFRLTQRMRFTAGLRASQEENALTTSGTGINDSPTPVNSRNDWDNTSWRLGFDYTRAGNLFYYASVATGFKSGGVAGFLRTGEFDTYDPEQLVAYEGGARFRSPGARWTLDGSVFLYDFKDLQVVTTTDIATAPFVLFSVDNATDARIRGVDLSVGFDFSERLTFSGGTVWMPTREFVDFTSAATGDVLSGNVLSRAPEWQASISIAYERSLRAMGNFSVRADYAWRSGFFFTKENEAASSQDAFGLLNLVTRFDSNRQWYVFLSARNLLDTDYFTQAFIQSSPGPPAQYEAGAGLRF